MERLVLDIQFEVAGSATIVFTVSEIVSQATYFKNMLVSNKMLSAFEQCRGYTNHPCAAYTDASLPQKVLLHMTRWLHVELLSRACSKRNVNVLSCSELSPGHEILFYFKDVVNKDVSRWQIGYISDAGDNFAAIRRSREGRGRGLKIALKDIQLIPKSPLQQR
jgi:hypothetical protein